MAQLPPLLPTNGGTIDFVARKVGIAGHAESIVAALIRELDRDRMPELVELDSLSGGCFVGVGCGADRTSLCTRTTFIGIAEKLCSLGRSRSLTIERGVS